ncbi:ribosomal-protein-alanine N-acetyltransferase [Frankineae bacterium MT45]|nr:ribosomal-protein-alanine N-acetyltransferase [Frankineae bacterium MT45]
MLSPATVGRVTQVALRRSTAAARGALRPQSWWNETLGPVAVRSGVVTLSPPRLRDAEQWCAARLANQQRLEMAFPAETSDWAAGQTPLVWTQRCIELRAAARRGLAYPYVIRLDGVVAGEYGIDAVDPETGTGEQSGWVAAAARGSAVAKAATLLGVLRAFTGPDPLRRIVGPNAVDSPAPGILLKNIGYQREIVLTGLRDTSAGRKDHEVWVVHNNAAVRQQLRDQLKALNLPS